MLTFDCKAGDGEKVTYEPHEVWGTEAVTARDVDLSFQQEPSTITVYLTCPQGHVYPYVVPA